MDRKLLMVAGPTEIEPDVLAAGAQPMVYNRTADFSAFMQRIEDNLKQVFKTKNDVLIMCSSGTGAMEAAVVNLLSEGDDVLVVSGGTFGHRWYEIASRYNVKCTVLELPHGETATGEMIRENLKPETKAVFVTANETSTGALTDLAAIGAVVKDTDAVLVVDAVSSLCADKLDTDAWYCDVVLTSSQKALALPPGLSFITLSEKAWRLVDESSIPKYYFDLKEYKSNLVRGQTPFTPAISLLYQLDVRLNKLCTLGVDKTLQNQKARSEYLQKGLSDLGLRIIAQNHSNGVIGVLFPPTIDAYEVIETLSKEYSIQITPSPGEDKHKIARIGIYGNISDSDIGSLLSALGKILESKIMKY